MKPELDWMHLLRLHKVWAKKYIDHGARRNHFLMRARRSGSSVRERFLREGLIFCSGLRYQTNFFGAVVVDVNNALFSEPLMSTTVTPSSAFSKASERSGLDR